MRNLPKLIDAVCEAYRNALPGGKWAPLFDGKRWYTYCNEGFNFICKRMGYMDFDKKESSNPDDALLANQMYADMQDPNGDWKFISNEEAQRLANDGALVAAIWKNVEGGPGHVCVVMPGQLEMSGSWAKQAPKVMNIGKDVFIGKRASWAFRIEPKYFVLKSML